MKGLENTAREQCSEYIKVLMEKVELYYRNYGKTEKVPNFAGEAIAEKEACSCKQNYGGNK